MKTFKRDKRSLGGDKCAAICTTTQRIVWTNGRGRKNGYERRRYKWPKRAGRKSSYMYTSCKLYHGCTLSSSGAKVFGLKKKRKIGKNVKTQTKVFRPLISTVATAHRSTRSANTPGLHENDIGPSNSHAFLLWRTPKLIFHSFFKLVLFNARVDFFENKNYYLKHLKYYTKPTL